MTPETIARQLAKTLTEKGAVTVMTMSGKRLFVALSDTLQTAEKGVMIAMENGGCYFWNGDREMNAFRLISSGFDMATSATLAEVLNMIHKETDLLPRTPDHENQKKPT